MPYRSVAFLLYFLGSSAGTLVFPMVGVVCYIILYHVFPLTTWWGKSLEFLNIRYSFTIGACLLIGTVLNLNKLRFGRNLIHPVEWGILFILFTMVLSGVTGTAWDDDTYFVLDKMLKVFLFTFMLSHIVVTRERIWIITVLLTVMAWYLGHEAHIAPKGSFNKGRLNGIGGPDFRESAGLAIHLFALLPFVLIVFRQKKIWLKGLAFFAGCYAINAILLCRARSAFLGGMAAALMAIWYCPRKYRRWVLTLLVIGSIGGIKLSDDWFWQRMVTIFTSAEERDDSARNRFIIWAAAREMIKEHPQGVGVGHFAHEIRKYDPENLPKERDAHNTFLLCFAETGVLGFCAYGGTIIVAWITLGRLNRRIRRELPEPELYQWLIMANRLSLIIYFVAGLFVSRYYTEGFWWFLVMPVCLSRCVENEIRDEVRDQAAIHVALERWLVQGGLPQLAR